MSQVSTGSRETQTQYDPEDVRVGQTLQALMHREELTEEGFLILRKITHNEMAQNLVINGKRGVHRTYVSQLCQGAKHLNNDMLYAIARYLGVNPIAIKRPDMDRELVAA
jgi:plasmid maintenance system antidote protein VapI